jgi:hypothetical protein
MADWAIRKNGVPKKRAKLSAPLATSHRQRHGIDGSEPPRSADDGRCLIVKKAFQRVKRWVRFFQECFFQEYRVPAKTGPSRLAHIGAPDCGSHRSRQGASAPTQHQGIDNFIDLEEPKVGGHGGGVASGPMGLKLGAHNYLN